MFNWVRLSDLDRNTDVQTELNKPIRYVMRLFSYSSERYFLQKEDTKLDASSECDEVT